MDRIDIHIDVPSVPFRELSDDRTGTDSARMRDDVLTAREMQHRRFHDLPGTLNGNMSPPMIRKHCRLDADAEGLLKTAMDEMGLSARAHDKILRISRTIADLEQTETITAMHLSEAINYRMLDRQFWS